MAALLLTSGAVLVLTCVSYFAYELVSFRRTTLSQLATLGQVVASNSAAALAFQSEEDAAQTLAALRADPHIVAAGLYGENGQLFARYPATLGDGALPSVLEQDGPRFEPGGVGAFQAVSHEGKRLGTLYLRSDLGAMYARLRFYCGMVIVIVAAGGALAFFMARTLQRQISAPLLALEDTARTISGQRNYSVRATKYGADEVGSLTDAFNTMLDQIEALNRDLEQRVVERTAQLEAANHDLESFSYSVSHDLRAPLRHIGGFATMLDRHAGKTLDDTGRRYLGVINDATKRMGQLIDDLLVFARNGRTELRRGPVSLDALVAEVRQGLQTETAGRTIVWSIEPLPTVQGDLALLRQVFANLIGNAVKYSRQRAEARIDITSTQGPNEIVVVVRDNGAGFDMKYSDKLFGVFQRLHQNEEFEGTGVGLATVRRIVQRHGGRVWAEAEVNKGATFYLAFPTAGNGVVPAAPARQMALS